MHELFYCLKLMLLIIRFIIFQIALYKLLANILIYVTVNVGNLTIVHNNLDIAHNNESMWVNETY